MILRPKYLKVDFLRTTMPNVPIMALTATATKNVCRKHSKGIKNEETIKCSKTVFEIILKL